MTEFSVRPTSRLELLAWETKLEKQTLTARVFLEQTDSHRVFYTNVAELSFCSQKMRNVLKRTYKGGPKNTFFFPNLTRVGIKRRAYMRK